MTATLLTVVENSPDAPLVTFSRLFDEAGLDVRIVRPHAGEAIPELTDLGSGLVVLGGHMSAYDDQAAPWLPTLRARLLDAARTGVPTLAVCLGAQLLAVAGGGQVTVAAPPGRESGAVRIFWRPEARTDDIVGSLARDIEASGGRASVYPSAHADAVSELPQDAVWLASSKMYPFQAFRLGSALAVQFHPEADAALVAQWLADADADEREAALTELSEAADRVAADGAALGAAFVARVLVAADALV